MCAMVDNRERYSESLYDRHSASRAEEFPNACDSDRLGND